MKSFVLGFIFFARVHLGLCETPLSEAVQKSQRSAVQAYPEIAVAGSPLNRLFIELYNDYRLNKPAYFKDDQWPLQLAEECVPELARREKEQAEHTTRNEHYLAEREIRKLALKDSPIPVPTTTPFDSDPQKRKEYLDAYKAGYRNALILERKIRFIAVEYEKSPLPKHVGWNGGTSDGYAFLEGRHTLDALKQALQSIAEKKVSAAVSQPARHSGD